MSRTLRKLARRPAPPGTRLPDTRPGRTPHGWAVVNPSATHRVLDGADRALLRVADAAARGVSRRQFLRVAAGAGFAIGLAPSFLFRPRRAVAHGVDCHGQSACGPSPLCADRHCGDYPLCAWRRDDTSMRTYGTSSCASHDNPPWCWFEHCCGTSYNGHATCCDCCAPSGEGSCDCGGGNRGRCICRQRENNC